MDNSQIRKKSDPALMPSLSFSVSQSLSCKNVILYSSDDMIWRTVWKDKNRVPQTTSQSYSWEQAKQFNVSRAEETHPIHTTWNVGLAGPPGRVTYLWVGQEAKQRCGYLSNAVRQKLAERANRKMKPSLGTVGRGEQTSLYCALLSPNPNGSSISFKAGVHTGIFQPAVEVQLIGSWLIGIIKQTWIYAMIKMIRCHLFDQTLHSCHESRN